MGAGEDGRRTLTGPTRMNYLTQYDRDRQELLSRLRWQYGLERALRIMSGDDAPTEEDRKAFRHLGCPKERELYT